MEVRKCFLRKETCSAHLWGRNCCERLNVNAKEVAHFRWRPCDWRRSKPFCHIDQSDLFALFLVSHADRPDHQWIAFACAWSFLSCFACVRVTDANPRFLVSVSIFFPQTQLDRWTETTPDINLKPPHASVFLFLLYICWVVSFWWPTDWRLLMPRSVRFSSVLSYFEIFCSSCLCSALCPALLSSNDLFSLWCST